MKKTTVLNASSLEEIVNEAEKLCAAEFAVVVARRSDDYPGGIVRGILIAQSLVVIIHYMLDAADVGGQWHPIYEADTLAFLILAAGLVAFGILSVWHKARLRLTSRSTIIRKVREAALAVFTENALFNTSHRRTVLVYISELERRVDLVVDSGLSGLLTEAVIVDFEEKGSEALARNFSHKTLQKLLHGLAEKIAQGGFPPGNLQTNEVDDNPVMR